MQPNILRRLESSVRSRLGLPRPWVSERLLGHDLVLRAGTIRSEIDYDDAWLYACLRNAENVFDVGANVGGSAVVGLLCPSVKQVVMIEANAEALSVAAQNLIRNNLSSRARFVCAFASDTSDGHVDFWTVGTGAAGSMYQGAAATASGRNERHRVPTTSLDDLCDHYGVVPDFVKIDVEGAESQVLRGSTKFAKQARSRMLVEMHSPPELPMARNAELVLAWTREVNYAAWYLSEGIRIETPAPIEKRGRCHLLLQPASWPYPPWLVGIKQSSPLPAIRGE